MSNELDKLREQIHSYLREEGFIVFQGYSRLMETGPMIQWDSHHYPDFRLFLECAKALGAKLIVFHHRELDSDFIDEALADLEVADLPDGESRRLGQRLAELRVWEGFTSFVELSFSHANQVYAFVLRADWYEEIVEIADEIDDYLSGDEPEGDSPDSIGGFFSRN